MNDDPDDYLVVSGTDEKCVWCPTVIPAGTPLELVVSHLDRRFWSCAPCARQARTTLDPATTETP